MKIKPAGILFILSFLLIKNNLFSIVILSFTIILFPVKSESVELGKLIKKYPGL